MKFSTPEKNAEGRFTSVITDDADKRMMIRLDNVNYLTGNKFHLGGEQLEALASVDQSVLDYAMEHKLEWFGRENIQDGTINKAFQESAEEEFFEPEYVKTKKGTIGVKYFDHNNEVVERGDEEYVCSMFLQVANVWFNKRNFGIEWKLLQVKINQEEVEELTVEEDYPEECLF